MKDNNDCEVCFKIKCSSCGWEPNDEELVQIQSGALTACPACGWVPGTENGPLPQ